MGQTHEGRHMGQTHGAHGAISHGAHGGSHGAHTWGHKSWGTWGCTHGGADLLCSCAPGDGIRGIMECQQEHLGQTLGADTWSRHMGVLTCCVAALQAMASEASWNASRNASPSVVTSYPLYFPSWVLMTWSCTSMAWSITSRSCAGVQFGCR